LLHDPLGSDNNYLREEDEEAQDFDENKSTSDRCQKSIRRPFLQNFLPLLQGYTREVVNEGPFLTKTKRSTEQQGAQPSPQQP
jgi:hypothetical protein